MATLAEKRQFFLDSGVKTLTQLLSEQDTRPGWENGAIRPEELHYSKDEVIAQGHHGTVYKGMCRGSQVAIKVLGNRNGMDESQIESLQREADIMRALRHPSILLLMGVCSEKSKLAIVTEFVAGRDLNAIIHDPAVEMSIRQKLNIAKGIAQGMNWLHCLQPDPIIHRDLKPANVLVTPEGNVKVCDFGLSCVKETYDPDAPPKDTVTGTAIYLAPEVLEGMPASEKSDIYAYAVLLSELFTRVKPFKEIDSIKKLHHAVVDGKQRPALIDAVPEAVAELLRECWHHDRDARPCFAEVLMRLDGVVVDLSLSHSSARTFWRELRPKHYPWAVTWDRFLEAFHRYAKPKLPLKLYAQTPEAKCAQLLLAVQNEDMTRSRDRQEWTVLLESFGRFTHLFGPFRPIILTKFSELCKTGCFHGTIEAKEAERRLASKKKGFILRLSAKDPSCVTISREDKGKARHLRVLRTESGFNVQVGKDVHCFPDLLAFLDSPQATKSGKSGLGLQKVCSKDSEYAAVHERSRGGH
ncbi:protein kinase domain containing protein [Acanthamoeba castellanii str. Neff]|uniref:Protein kinase domain containing protein n=1 Tax=Acanthamoeba castellanii (strain ATCC 30010 / Neff) TaxID=1257118 RepID=L8H9E0_ACACF|nr:protein kinase domain containing protein [Acanthamoeba castellanii str. Neff]ELR21800.1 protein kinase domain containing protein [Acanthamoeba castellanii str. Neff]